MSFDNAPIEQVCRFIGDSRNKPVLLHDSVKGKTLTIISNKKLPLKEALAILEDALRQSGIVLEESSRTIRVVPVSMIKQMTLPVVPGGTSVSTIADDGKIVDKIFVLKHYEVAKVKEIILPMLSIGHVTCDTGTRTLVVADTVGTLKRIEQTIAILDVPASEQSRTEIIQVEKGDAAEIVSVVTSLLKGLGRDVKDVTTATPARGDSPPSQGPGPMRPEMMGMSSRGGPGPGGPPSPGGGGPAPATPTTVAIDGGKPSVVMVPDVSHNRIIVVAPTALQEQIREWVTQLDQSRRTEDVFETISVEQADVDDVASQITKALENMPQSDLKQGVRVVPLYQGKKLLVFGSPAGRKLVADLLNKMDLQNAAGRVTKVFTLQNADAEQVAKDIDTLYSGRYLSYESTYSKMYSRDGSDRAKVKVTSDTRRNTVTVITDASTMAVIEKMILEQWDKSIAADEVEPRVYTLKYVDPMQVKDLLENMFCKKQKSFSVYDMFYGGSSGSETTPVGRLFGQFSFQALTNSNQLVVTTKNAANYVVIDRLIEKLDTPQEAGLPHVIELKHANAEDLAEQLNAILAEPRTPAMILRSQRDLSPNVHSISSDPAGGSSGSSSSSSMGRSSSSSLPPPAAANAAGAMTFWWQFSNVTSDKEKPASNLIGKIRIVPVYRRNALMVIAPPAYQEQIDKLVQELDQPGMQVVVHAIIAEITHNDVTTLGVRFASDPSVLADPRLNDQAIAGNTSAAANNVFDGFFGMGNNGSTTVNTNVRVNVLLQLLKEKFDLKVLFEPKIYTADNQEAQFFNGQEVSVETNFQSSPEGTSINRSFQLKAVGTLLRVRPHITKDGGVDLNINLELSDIAQGVLVNGQPVFDLRETSTHVILCDGQTVMISGIVQQEEFNDVRKLPLLGDIPILGLLFRNVDKAKRNRELVAFITPHVIRDAASAGIEMKQHLESLDRLRTEMGQTRFKGSESSATSCPADEKAPAAPSENPKP